MQASSPAPRLVAPGKLSRTRRAFSLLEIMIAIAILGLIVGVLIQNVTGQFDNAQEDVAKTFVSSSMELPLTSYRLHVGDYPSTADGLAALNSPPQARADRWRGPYVTQKIPNDPWGNPYQYRYPGTHNKGRYDIWSRGRDGQDGTADDIGNWEKADAQAK